MSGDADAFARAANAADGASSADPTGVEQPCPLAKKDWIEIELLGEDGSGIGDEVYRVTLPDASTRTGKLDARGRARIEAIPSGVCVVQFPDMDRDAWAPEPS